MKKWERESLTPEEIDAVIDAARNEEEQANEKWNENIETCSDCGIEWKKIGKSCPVCYSPAEHK